MVNYFFLICSIRYFMWSKNLLPHPACHKCVLTLFYNKNYCIPTNWSLVKLTGPSCILTYNIICACARVRHTLTIVLYYYVYTLSIIYYYYYYIFLLKYGAAAAAEYYSSRLVSHRRRRHVSSDDYSSSCPPSVCVHVM